jgi:fatty-acyl-CoA synthase
MSVGDTAILDLKRLPNITFVGEGAEEHLILADCQGEVRMLCEVMLSRFKPGNRVGLLYQSEPQLVLSWLAALYAGLEPLILQFPNAKQNLAAWRGSIEHIVQGVNLAGIMCSEELQRLDLDSYRPLYLPHAHHSAAERTGLPAVSGSAAILQMSSGTTGQRKPIRFTLAQVAAHVRDYDAVLRLGANDRVVSWLPLYHDMGFIACFVMPLLLGVPVVMMDPMTWVREPRRLFDAIRQYGATMCYMPNFGFEVMAKHADGQGFPSMRRWISCSEPVLAATLERFAAATRTSPRQLSACYAMAENVFAISQRDGVEVVELDGRFAVSCGRPIPNVQAKLVDGEIWVRSPSSLNAYLDGAPITDADGFYPTGDLGSMVDGELIIVGRKHDLINVAGKKLILSDLDQCLNRVLPTSDGRAAALAKREAGLGTELPLFLVEDADFYLRRDSNELRARLAAEIDVESFALEFVPPGFLTKTSSGKINRSATLANYELSTSWRARSRGEDVAPSLEEETLRLFGSAPRDRPLGDLLDSLGLAMLSMLVEEAGIKLNPQQTLQDHLSALRNQQPQPQRGRPDDAVQEQIAIVSIADSRTIVGITAAHLRILSEAAGLPVTLEYVCLPPTPIILSDLVFMDYFLPRDQSAKYQPVISALSKLRDASLLLVDDIAEMVFGQFAYPALNHRFERSAAADLLVWRWQKYAQLHHQLPISVVNLWGTQAKRNAFIRRLSVYLGVPVFRIATLHSFAEHTLGWEHVARSNADWASVLEVDADALVARLKSFLLEQRARLPHRIGPMGLSPRIQDMHHFCSVYIDRDKVESVLLGYDRFCLIGFESSAPFVRRRLDQLGKRWFQVNSLNLSGQGYSDDDFDCVLQVGSWGRVKTSKPVYQIFSAGWEPSSQPATLDGQPITDPGWFHGNYATAPNELSGEKDLLRDLAR